MSLTRMIAPASRQEAFEDKGVLSTLQHNSRICARWRVTAAQQLSKPLLLRCSRSMWLATQARTCLLCQA